MTEEIKTSSATVTNLVITLIGPDMYITGPIHDLAFAETMLDNAKRAIRKMHERRIVTPAEAPVIPLVGA